jgi:hypothetical protein
MLVEIHLALSLRLFELFTSNFLSGESCLLGNLSVLCLLAVSIVVNHSELLRSLLTLSMPRGVKKFCRGRKIAIPVPCSVPGEPEAPRVQIVWWAILGSNQRPLPCQGSALPLRQSPKS